MTQNAPHPQQIHTHIKPESEKRLKDLYQLAKKSPEQFWKMIGERLSWFKPWTTLKKAQFNSPVHIEWYNGGTLNVSFNCIDRHLQARGDKTALIWEADDPQTPSRKFTYKELAAEVFKMANTLKKLGVKKGDRVTIYMPMIPEAAFAMLACSRVGACHNVVFGGFSPDSIADRMIDGKSDFIITASCGVRGGKIVPLKDNVDQAIALIDQANAKSSSPINVRSVLVVKHLEQKVQMNVGRDYWYHEISKDVGPECPPAEMKSEDPLFLLYTSGSTNKPKGVLHTTAGYLAWASFTHELVFDLKEDDIFWCTADVGWVTGHSYLVYGPLANGATTVMFEGVPNYPATDRFWQVIDKHSVSIFYTAPTALRALMREGDAPVKKHSRKSLRVLGTVGEPINPEAWLWYYNTVGDARCPIVDTWWQTETGGMLISPVAFAHPLKPGSATFPLPGVETQLVDEKGTEITAADSEGDRVGHLCLQNSWPGQMRTVFGDHPRFEQTYFSTYQGRYFTGDGCRIDSDGDFWITGRVDDVLNVAGHRLGTAEIESALVGQGQVAEAAVVGFPHSIKGQGVYAFVTLKAGVVPSEQVKKDLIMFVRQHISPIAAPDLIQWAPGLPKTRSGKIMRRILRKIAEAGPGPFAIETLGDTTTLADPGVVQDLVNGRLTESK